MKQSLISTRVFCGRHIVIATLFAAVTACASERTVSEPTVLATRAYSDDAKVTVPTLLECPTNTTTQASGLVTPLGGVVSAGGTTITVPAGAVLVPTTIVVTVPASNYMEVDISAEGAASFSFELPVTISISYDRCSRSNIEKGSLSAWHIDSQTKALLNNMGGTDDKSARKVTFPTDHLTGYAVAS